MSIREHKIAELNVLDTVGEKDGEVIILLHGFGASKEDLFPLHQHIKSKKGTRWIFPDAPIEMNLGGYTGRAWFPLMSSDIDYIQKKGKLDFSDLNPKGLAEANQKINSLINSLDVPYHKITIGGFSQGSMLSVDVVLRRENLPAGLIILSGTLVSQNDWTSFAKQKSKLQFFQSHGLSDSVLPFQAAKNLETILRGAGLSGEFVEFSGGHEIPEKVCKRLGEYICR